MPTSHFLCSVVVMCAFACAAFPVPRPSLRARLHADKEIIGIVHWGLNTYTDREWGFGDEDPKLLNPSAFDADQICTACADGGLCGLVVVAKHHDGFCLWPTKTTEHNISKSPFRGGKGDYVREMANACRRAGMMFGVYVSPWDRNNADYAKPKYVEAYHAQLKELIDGSYGDVFELWFDGANGGDGYYGGTRERRVIGADYYRFDDIFAFARKMQPNVCIFDGEHDGSDFRWPGNEKGILDPNSRATICTVGGFSMHSKGYGNPNYGKRINIGCADGEFFRMCEADFPLRPGFFYHAKHDGKSKHAAYLMKLYLLSVGNGGVMNIGISPDKRGLLTDEDVQALRGFGTIRKAFFTEEVKDPVGSFNVIVMRETLERGEEVDSWCLDVGGKPVLKGEAIGNKRIRTFDRPLSGACQVVARCGAKPVAVSLKRYFVDPELLSLVMTSTTESGETDTAKWMTGKEKERK